MLLGFALAACAAASAAASPGEADRAAPEAEAVRQLRDGEALDLEVPLAAGQVLGAELETGGRPVRLELRPPAGEAAAAAETDGGTPLLGVSAIAASPGTWTVSVRFPKGASGGRGVRLHAQAPRLAAEHDRSRSEGMRALAEALARRTAASPQAEAEATALAERAAALLTEGGDPRWTAWARWLQGEALYERVEPRPALTAYALAEETFERLGDGRGQAHALCGRGFAEAAISDFGAAVEHLTRAERLAARIGDPRLSAQIHLGLGLAYGQLRELELAATHLGLAVAAFRAERAEAELADCLQQQGYFLSLQGARREARGALREARSLFRRLGDRRGEAGALANLGNDLFLAGRSAEALAVLREAIALSRASGDRAEEASATFFAAKALTTLGRLDEAVAYSERAAATWREVGALDSLANVLEWKGLALARAGRLEAAAEAAGESVALSEAGRRRSAGTGSALAGQRRRYEVLADALARQEEREPGRGRAEQALAVSEQAHARGLLELLGEARVDLRRGVDPALLEQEREAGRALESASARQARLAVAGKAAEPERAEVREALRAATVQLAEARARVRAASARYAEVVDGEVPRLAEIQGELGPDGLLLEYLLGEDQSYLWAVDAGGATLHRLPGRARIEEAARRLHRAWSEGAPPDEERRLAAEASRLLLGPVAGRLARQRLVVVADGALHYLPFAALPRPGGGDRLVTAHEIVNLPSMAVLAALRRQVAGRAPATRSVALLADPVFDRRDRRVRSSAPRLAEARLESGLARSARDVGLGGLARLPGTRREAERIAAMVPPGQLLAAFDFGAARELVTGGGLAGFRVLHFATHGLLDNRSPGLSGLVLSLVDEAGEPRNGFLRTSDVFGLTLPADLVVLSACQTALGPEARGEGLLGLTRGFMYAGAPRVVASLWKVPDAATAELMRRFYEGLLQRGLPAAAALRAAQRAVAAEPRWAGPNAWAGFTLQGLWD